MKNRLKLSAILLVSVSAILIFASTILPSFGQEEADELAYLPQIHLAPTPTPSPSPTPSCTYTAIDSSDLTIENNVANAIQTARQDNNVSTLNQLDNITTAARSHSQDMAQNNFVDHQGSDDQYGPYRLRQYCYDVVRDQEIVWGGTFSDTTSLINSWLEDPNFGPVILDDNMKDFGVGYIKADVPEGEEAVREDYFTVSFGYTAGNQRIAGVSCQIELENEYGKGVLITSSPEICQNANR